MNLLDTPSRPLQPPDRGSLTTEQTNRLQAALEDKARTEANTGERVFTEWLVNMFDLWELKDIIINCIDADLRKLARAQHEADNIAARYVTDRVQSMDANEIDAVERELFNDGSDADE
jgi:ABC-type histidine transport system ATPase subunit